MNIVQIYILDYDGNILDDHIFHTNTPCEFFYTSDYDITDGFRYFLKKNYPSIYEEIMDHDIDILYYPEESINKI